MLHQIWISFAWKLKVNQVKKEIILYENQNAPNYIRFKIPIFKI
jgi:hypothetical protein